MKTHRIIEAWKNEEVLEELSAPEKALLPTNPAGVLAELMPEDLSSVSGGSSFACITTSSWVCGVTVTITVCDELQDWINESLNPDPNGGGSSPPVFENKQYCFAAATPVRTPLSAMPISALQPGDEVLAFDPELGMVCEAAVSAVEVHDGCFPLLDVISGADRVQVTTGHRFRDRDSWQPVEAFAGQRRAMDAHQNKRPLHLSTRGASAARVYNLRVEGLQNYFVGQHELLVRDH